MSEHPVTDEARNAAHEATACDMGEPGWTQMLGKSPYDLIDIALDAAAPLIRAGEWERLGREQAEHQERYHCCPTCGGDMTVEPSRVITEALAAERERIAAELNNRAGGLGAFIAAATGRDRHDYELIEVTLRNTAWAIVHGDHAENLHEPDPAPTGECP